MYVAQSLHYVTNNMYMYMYMYYWHVHVHVLLACTCTIYIWHVHVQFTFGMYMYNLHLCIYMYTCTHAHACVCSFILCVGQASQAEQSALISEDYATKVHVYSNIHVQCICNVLSSIQVYMSMYCKYTYTCTCLCGLCHILCISFLYLYC